jgi:hypothetical protein
MESHIWKLGNKINTLNLLVENSIHKNNMQTIDKPAATKRCKRKITEGQWVVLRNHLSDFLGSSKAKDVMVTSQN